MKHSIYLFLFTFLGISLPIKAEIPDVVVTIKPIHSLVAGIMDGLKAPTLLLGGERSPHTQPLNPDEVRRINAAKVIIWVGPSYETPLQGVIGTQKSGKHVITLLNKPGLFLYPIRQGGVWGDHKHSDGSGDKPIQTCVGHNHGHHKTTDGHIWLDPDNAKAIVLEVAAELSILDPQNEKLYQENAARVIVRLDELDQELKVILNSVVDQAYVVYHDGTQYFDRHFKTRAVGVLIGDSHYGTNAQHFLQVSEYIRVQKVRCIFTEPQFPTDKIHALMDKTGTRIETLDYLGIHIKAGKDAYFLMMRNLANAFRRGLREPS